MRVQQSIFKKIFNKWVACWKLPSFRAAKDIAVGAGSSKWLRLFSVFNSALSSGLTGVMLLTITFSTTLAVGTLLYDTVLNPESPLQITNNISEKLDSGVIVRIDDGGNVVYLADENTDGDTMYASREQNELSALEQLRSAMADTSAEPTIVPLVTTAQTVVTEPVVTTPITLTELITEPDTEPLTAAEPISTAAPTADAEPIVTTSPIAVTEPVTVIASEEATSAAEETMPAPEETTPAPEETTPAPEETTAAPEETTAAPEETTAAPEETTPAPEETTPAPATTTNAPITNRPPTPTTTAPVTTTAPITTTTTEPTTTTTEPTTTTTEPTTTTTEPTTTTPEETTTTTEETTIFEPFEQDPLSLSAPNDITGYTYGDVPIVLTLKGGSGYGAVTYTSSDEDVATVSNSGWVIFNKAGTVTITVTKAADDDYKSATATLNLTVAKRAMSNVAVTAVDPVTYTGDAYTDFTATDDPWLQSTDYTVSYADNINAGTATITLTATADGNYTGTATGTFTIEKAQETWVDPGTVNRRYNTWITPATINDYIGNMSPGFNNPLPDGYTFDEPDFVLTAGVHELGAVYHAPAPDKNNDNYEPARGTITFDIAKSPNSARFADNTVRNYTYGEGPFELEAVALLGDGEERYTSSDENVVTIESISGYGKSRLTIKGAGTATITVIKEADDNYEEGTNSIVITVAQADGVWVDIAPVTATYSPTLTLANVNLPAGYAWRFPTTAITAAGNGQEFPATFTDPSGNYPLALGTIAVNVGTQIIQTSGISVSIAETFYTGLPQTPKVTLTHTASGVELIENTDFELSITTTPTDAGTHNSIGFINGIGNYHGQRPINVFTIKKAPNNMSFNTSSGTYTFGDNPFSLSLNDNVGGGALTYSSSVPSVATITNTAVVTIVGVGTTTITAVRAANDNYEEGTATFVLTVTKAPGEWVAPTISTVTYTPTLTLANISLPAGYVWEDSTTAVTSAGSGQEFPAIFTHPNGNYEPVQGDIAVTIARRGLSENGITVTDNNAPYIYNSSPQRPTVTVTDGAITLVEGVDYQLEERVGDVYLPPFEPKTDAGTYIYRVYGIGNYTSYIERTFTIEKANGTFTTPAALNTTYTPTLTLANVNPPVNYAWVDSTTAITNIGTQSFPAIFTDPVGNFEPVEGNITVIVATRNIDYTTITDNVTYTYNSSPQRPNLTVMDGTVQLVEDTDYKLEDFDGAYSPFALRTNAGTYTYRVTGMGKYSHWKEHNFVIEKAAGAWVAPTATVSATYTPTLTLADMKLPANYEWVGDTTMKLTRVEHNGRSFPATFTDPSGNYEPAEGEIAVTIPARNIANADTFIDNATYTYNGLPQRPTLTIMDGTVLLVEGKDYNLKDYDVGLGYSDFASKTNAGTYTYRVEGIMGNYTHWKELDFVIEKAPGDFGSPAAIDTTYKPDLTLADLTLPTGYEWDSPTTTLTVADSGQSFPATYTQSDNHTPATGNITVNVAKANQDPPQSFTVPSGPYTYGDAPIQLTFSGGISEGGITCSSSDETIATVSDAGYVTFNAAGTVIITVTRAEDDNYNSSTATRSITIEKRDLGNVMVSAAAQTFTGSALEPTVTAIDDNWLKSTDYNVSYLNNVNVGTATITLTATTNGNYTGTKTGTFEIQKAPGTFTTLAEIDTTYTPTLKLADLTLPANYAWADSATAIDTAGDGQEFPATFTDPGGNYETATGNIIVNVAKADQEPLTLTAPGDVKDYTYGDPAIQLTASGGSVAGNPAYSSDAPDVATVSALGFVTFNSAGKVTITATKAADTNYNEVSATLELNVDKRNLSYVTVEADDVIYTGSALEPTITATDFINGENVVTIADFDVEYDDNIDVGTATFTLTATDDGNYTGTQTGEFEILRKCNVANCTKATTVAAKVITTQAELRAIPTNSTDCYVLGNDINWDGTIGSGGTFRGHLDGDFHVIRNLNISGGDNVGLFTQMNNVHIQNLGFVNPTVTASNSRAGTIVGEINGGTNIIERCFVEGGTVTGNANMPGALVGGVAGTGTTVVIRDSYIRGTAVNLPGNGGTIGGIVGTSGASNTTFERVYFVGTTSKGSSPIGGGNIIDSYYDKDVYNTTANATHQPFGRTTAEMRTEATYTNWIFGSGSTWNIDPGFNQGYPTLRGFSYAPEAMDKVAQAALVIVPPPPLAVGDAPVQLLTTGGSSGGTVTYVSSNPTIATVTSAGLLTVISDGGVSIIATMAGDDNYNAVTTNIGLTITAFGGSGTASDPYRVGTQEQLRAVGHSNAGTYSNWGLAQHYVMTRDITLTGGNWVIVGDTNNKLTGSFDGKGFSITGLKIETDTAWGYSGMFNTIGAGGVVKNLSLNVNITGGSDYMGGIAGANDGTVDKCYVSGTISGGNYVGGIVGWNNSTVSNCHNAATVSGNQNIGGIVGQNGHVYNGNSSESVVTNCANTGNVSGTGMDVGGIAGYNGGSGTNGTVGSRATNCVSLGLSIAGTSGRTWRIVGGGDNGSQALNNYASANTLVNGNIITDGTLDNVNGANITSGNRADAEACIAGVPNRPVIAN